MSTDTEELTKLQEALGPLADQAEPTENCPEPETIWAAVQGRLQGGEMRAVVDHVGSCLVCAEAWEVADDMVASRDGAEPARSSPTAAHRSHRLWWLGAAAAALVAFLVLLPSLPSGSNYRNPEQNGIKFLTPPTKPLTRQDCRVSWTWTGSEEEPRYHLRVRWLDTETPKIVVEVPDLEVSEYRISPEDLSDVTTGAKLLWRVEALELERSSPASSEIYRLE